MFSQAINIRWLHQSHSWTVAALASARPKGKLDQPVHSCEDAAVARGAPGLMGRRESGAQHLYQYNYSKVSVKEHSELESEIGSFSLTSIETSCHRQDEDLMFHKTTPEELLARCEMELQDLPRPFERHFQMVTDVPSCNDEEREEKGVHDDCPSNVNDGSPLIRIFQWNVLSQALGTEVDNFVCCHPSALDWRTRRWRMVEEIIRYNPDIICLQEVDHFNFLQRALGSIGYTGSFLPKPDSACNYLETNTGPDGCVIFYKKATFDLVSSCSKVLQVWGVLSNQVILGCNLRHKETSKEICVATTHLKARSGTLLSELRNEQGKDILAWLAAISENRPVILTGDFNDEPSEPVFKTVTQNDETPLVSAYRINENMEDNIEYTSWKIRETGEQKHILDYIFHSPQLQTVSTLSMPTEEEIGEHRLPSLQFGSDHLSLVIDLQIN